MQEAKKQKMQKDQEIFLIPSKVDGFTSDKPFIAFEYYPPRTNAGVESLKMKLARMKKLNPLYVDFTWGAGGTTSELTQELCTTAQEDFRYVANMHLTCTNMPKEKIDIALELSLSKDIRNILALRGDPPVGQKDWKPVESGFSCALDLVKYIKDYEKEKEKEGFFGISVAAYPEGHPNVIKEITDVDKLSDAEKLRVVKQDDKVFVCSDEDFISEMKYLKSKVDAGANMIVTQMFFDVDTFLAFQKACKEYEINVPIIPGIMCISSFGGFKRMVKLCKTRVPNGLAESLAEVENDRKQFIKVVVGFLTDMCQRLLTEGKVPGLHFYTLNMDEVVVEVLKKLKLYAGNYSFTDTPNMQ
eukprot:snap_masked-scaffold_17-processed-gene-6.44-mRNA-1 protein AED:0.01 eAED:0.01 QI:0/-1/0/1/-1/1/1/0/357